MAPACDCGETGRRTGLKILSFRKGRAGSIPASRTNLPLIPTQLRYARRAEIKGISVHPVRNYRFALYGLRPPITSLSARRQSHPLDDSDRSAVASRTNLPLIPTQLRYARRAEIEGISVHPVRNYRFALYGLRPPITSLSARRQNPSDG